jgi:pimeloyl-ACP methyl ester carboxylesterase
MHGGWCWRHVHHELSRRGHDVHRPTLTGQGDRRAGLAPGVGVGTHVQDLEDLVWFEDLDRVHLVLHSYAGVLAGPLAERLEGRLASVVYLGAFVTAPGESLLDVEPVDVADRYRRQVAEGGEGWYLPATDAFLGQWGIRDPTMRSWVGSRLTAFPFRCQTEPTRFDPEPLGSIRKVYVAHTDPPLASLQRFYDAAVVAGWETHELRCGHDMMLAAPLDTADLLETIAGGA